MEEDILQSAEHREIVRIGNTVHRPVHRWSSSVHALLNHLELAGFQYSPRMLGFDDQGREIVSYIEGDSGAAGWSRVLSEEGLQAFAGLLRDYHEAVSDFRPSTSDWSTGMQTLMPGEVITHGDFAPWNVVWRDFEPVGLIDWDYARPAKPWVDVAYALEYVVPFREDSLCISWMHHPVVPDRARRLRTFVDAYGGDSSDDWPSRVIGTQQQGIDLVAELAKSGAEPQATWARDGYLDQLKANLQWSKDNRRLFRAATKPY